MKNFFSQEYKLEDLTKPNFNKFDHYFMKIAKLTAELSHAKRLQVGSVLVRDNRILLCGYNGMPEGMDNVCEDEDGHTKSEVLHSEENLILYAAKKGIQLEGSKLYITHYPCSKCSNLIIGSGIRTIIYAEEYHSKSHGTDKNVLLKNGINVIHFSEIKNTHEE